MLGWFKEKAPIRQKFSFLVIVLTMFAAVGPITTALALSASLPGMLLIVLALASLLAVTGTMLIAREYVCRPYVDTVVRMEALAVGDTESPFAYSHHTDCVGRMTKAMETFRDNARVLQEQNEVQVRVVDTLSQALKLLGEKRLNCRIEENLPAHYEALRQDFNRAVDALGEAISAVSQTADAVMIGSSEIHTAAADLSQRNENQAASLEEASAAMGQVTQSVHEAAQAAQAARLLIEKTQGEALEGDSVVEKAVRTMGQIEQSASEIGKIVDVIDGIAFQTNLLALNAGVEAARAGDAGKGFAVVANEVRALAQRSADAARDIGELIRASTVHVASGVQLVGETGTLLSNIVARIRDVNGKVAGIADNAQNQADNLTQVNATVSDLDRVTQQNAAMVEQASAATRSLSDESRRLSSVVRGFTLGNAPKGGFEAETRRPAPALVAMRTQAAPSMPARPSLPAVTGNLALNTEESREDWAEF